MKNNTSRIIIETIVKRTLRNIKDSPERSIRNLVDMALHFSGGRFQRNFFEVAQTMLQNENSPYYGLIEDTVSHVDAERILRFGMNIGYNSCTIGAKTIREIERKENYNIPWMVSLYLDTGKFYIHQKKYQSFISQGENLGIYTWVLFPDENPQKVLSLVQSHPDSAFILFCSPREITQDFTSSASMLKNLMIVVQYKENVHDACRLLREKGLLYSIYFCYRNSYEETIINGHLIYNIQRLHPVFTILHAATECSAQVKEKVYETVKQARKLQKFQTIVWESTYDSCFVDGIISNESCLATFNSEGYLLTLQEAKANEYLNLFHNDLAPILKTAFPKSIVYSA